ncbi:hypothetical protein AVEN_189415-1, partial [Araneus ventricosus]
WGVLGFQFWLPPTPRRCKNALCCIVDVGAYFSTAAVRCVGQVLKGSMTRKADCILSFPFSRVGADFGKDVMYGSACIAVAPLSRYPSEP